MVRMAQQEWQQQGSGNARRRSLETAMKEQQERTKVVVRRLPPSLPGAVFQDQIAAKYAGVYAWCSFLPGKSNHKRQAYSRAYINFKKPEDVIDFCADFNGHVFVNERGAQYKAVVEYAPYQRVPKPRSKKDVRESSIFKDPEYVAFVEQLAKPAEYLPSAEIQLERRDAEKAAALASGASKDVVVVTPLMEYVRLRRAAKSTPQRGTSSGAKLAARSGSVSAGAYSTTPQKRSTEKGRSGSSPYIADSSLANKESVIHSGVPREEIQRKERESLIERKRKEAGEGKEKKSAAATSTSTRTNSATSRVDSSKEKNVFLTKDSSETGSVSEGRALQILSAGGESGSRTAKASSVSGPGESTASGDGREPHKREYKKKQLLGAKEKDKESSVESGHVGAATNGVGSGSTHSQRHRSSGSLKVAGGGGQQAQSVLAYRATSPGDVSSGKQSHRQEAGARSSGRGSVPQGTSSAGAGLDSPAQSQLGAPQVERAGKRPPRPQAIRLAGKEQAVSLVSLEAEAQASNGEEKVVKQVSSDGASMTLASEKQDARRLRNKDRPDRPVWTPRRRDGVAAKGDGAASANGATPTGIALIDGLQGSVQSGTDAGSKSDRMERSSVRQNGQSGSEVRSSEPLQTSGGSGGNVTSGKLRYVEAGGRGARGGRVGPVAALQDAKGDGLNGDGKNQDVKQARENGEALQSQLVLQSQEVVQVPGTEDRKKQDCSLWSESAGGGHRQGGRRDRTGQAGPKEGEGGITGTEVTSKLMKRGRGPPPLGSNEKQVWVAVQKAVSG